MNDKKFWLEDKSPKQVFNEFIKPENSSASLWDIFSSYEPDIYVEEPPDKSERWLEKQNTIINTILSDHLNTISFNKTELDNFIAAIEEYCLPEGDQDIEYLKTKHNALALKIAREYLIPEQLNERTLYNCLDTLEKNLKTKNKDLIIKSEQDTLLKQIESIPYYVKSKKEELISNLKKMWEFSPEDNDNDDFEEEDEINRPQFTYPTFSFAYSNTFYGFDDAGDLFYEEQEALAQEKFIQYTEEITELLNLQPNRELHPASLDFIRTEEYWHAHEEFMYNNPFAYEFEGDFVIWEKEDKVLFLSMKKEDKELPYEIELGGLTLDAYQEILTKYNELISKFCI